MKKITTLALLLISFIGLAQTVSPGDIVITEIMIDPNSNNEQDREWFEVYNTTSSPIDMNGWIIGDNSSSGRDHLITSTDNNGAVLPVVIPANGYAVFVYNDDSNVAITLPNTVYVYGAATGMSNSGFPTWNNESTYSGGSTNDDGIELIAPDGMGGTITIDNILYGFGYNGLNAWPDQGAASSVSYQLNGNTLDSASNDAAANWVASTNIFGSFNSTDYRGTPGTANFGFSSGVLAPGDVLITEIMIDANGSEANTEWIEIYNTTDNDIDLVGWTIGDSSSSGRAHVITAAAPVMLLANSYGVLSPTTDSSMNGGITNVLYAYGFNSPVGGPSAPGTDYPRFNNESSFDDGTPDDNEIDGVFIVSVTGLELDRVDYDYGYGTAPIGFPTQGQDDGASLELGFSFFDVNDNDDSEAWDFAITPFGTVSNSFGTPGLPNDFNKVFTYDNAWLAPFNDASGNTNTTADLVVLNGTATLTSNTIIQSINIETSGSMNVDMDVVLTVSENVLVNGDLNANDAIVFFNGNTSQMISGAGTVSLGTIDLDNAAGLSSSSTVDLYNELTISTGDFDNTGTFTLKNTATSTAVINELPATSSITGDFIAERFIPISTAVDGRVYRFLSSPVTTTTTIYDNWQEAGASVAGKGTHITGAAGTAGTVDMTTGFDQTVSGNVSAFRYSNDTNQTWDALTSTNQSGDELTAMDAYRVFIRGDRDMSRLSGSIAASATTLSTTGTVNQGDQTLNYDVEENEFVFIGNPYQSAVDMESILANSDNVNNDVIYYWDPNLGGLNGRGAYTTVSGFAAGGIATALPSSPNSDFIQPGQAAFVVATTGANGAGNDMVLRFRESDKGTSTDLSSSTVFGINNTASNQLVVTLFDTASLQVNSSPTDAVMLRVDHTFSNVNDNQDFLKPTNLDETLSIVGTNAAQYGVQSISQVQDGMMFPLNITNYGDANYTFRIDVSTFVGFNVALVDNFLGTRTALNNSGMNEVSFAIDDVNASSALDRFAIAFENSTLSNEDNLLTNILLYPNPATDFLSIELEDTNWTSLSIFNVTGQEVMIVNEFSNRINISSLQTGTYFVNVKTAQGSETIQFLVK